LQTTIEIRFATEAVSGDRSARTEVRPTHAETPVADRLPAGAGRTGALVSGIPFAEQVMDSGPRP